VRRAARPLGGIAVASPRPRATRRRRSRLHLREQLRPRARRVRAAAVLARRAARDGAPRAARAREVRRRLTGEDAAGVALTASRSGRRRSAPRRARRTQRLAPAAPRCGRRPRPTRSRNDAASGTGRPEGSTPPDAPHDDGSLQAISDDSGEFERARYAPDRGSRALPRGAHVTSLEARFRPYSGVALPRRALPARQDPPEDDKGSPFYTSGWFWAPWAVPPPRRRFLLRLARHELRPDPSSGAGPK